MLTGKSTATLFFFLFLIILNAQDDLILLNENITMYGEHTYGKVLLTNSIITVDPSTGFDDGRGTLILYADTIIFDNNSSIQANGAGGHFDQSSAGVGNSDDYGSGGGGYGGVGGSGGSGGATSNGGSTYGQNDILQMGSRGGSSNPTETAGSGGGAIKLDASYINISGGIIANGLQGSNGVNSAHYGNGGGSGGHIMINATILSISGWIQANGGTGGNTSTLSGSAYDGGGGGGGGRIMITSSNYEHDESIFSALGMPGGSGFTQYGGVNGLYGQDGVIQVEIDSTGLIDWISSTTNPDQTLFYLVNQPEMQLAIEEDIDGFFYEISNSSDINVNIESDYIISDGDTTLFVLDPISDGTWYFNAIPFSG